MLRLMTFVAGVLYLSGQVLAATEADRRGCASEHNGDIRITACTRVIEDKTTAPAVRTMAFRDRGVAYANKGLQELAIADFDEALKVDAKDPAAFSGRGKAYQARGSTIEPLPISAHWCACFQAANALTMTAV